MDPFDDVREGAASILASFPQEVIVTEIYVGDGSKPRLLELLGGLAIETSQLASRTGRADHADGAARTQGLMCLWEHDWDNKKAILENILGHIDMKLTFAEEDLGRAALDHPVHGDFAAAR